MAASMTPPVAPNSLPAVVSFAKRRVGGVGRHIQQIEPSHPNDLGPILRRRQHGVDVGDAVRAHFRSHGLEFFGGARHHADAVDPRGIDPFALGKMTL